MSLPRSRGRVGVGSSYETSTFTDTLVATATALYSGQWPL